MTATVNPEQTRATGTPPGNSDLVPLLEPIRADAPAGDWLYYDRSYDALRDARREDDASLPRGIWKRDLKRANWPEVESLATTALATRTKDLQIAAWLLEAWTRQYGFTGALRGFQLLHGLCERYWDGLYPQPDGEDVSARTHVIDWVNEHLVVILQDIPLTRPTDLDNRAWTWSDRVEALRAENLVLRGAANPPAPNANVLTSAKMFSSIITTPRPFFARLTEDLAATIDAVRAVELYFDERCGTDAPSLTRVLESLKTVHQWAVGVVAQQGKEDPPPAAAPAASPPDAESKTEEPMEATPAPDGQVQTTDHARARADAYRKLAEAAHTLMRIEPHSPTPYLVFRAIAWGEMSLAQLMRHFISSGYDLKSLYAMLGMEEKPPAK